MTRQQMLVSPQGGLALLYSEDELTIIEQQEGSPIFKGEQSEGLDYVCYGCNSSVLAEGIGDEQLWELVFVCAGCGAYNATSNLPPHSPLPRSTHWLPPGRHRLPIVPLHNEVVVVGATAWLQRQRERRVGLDTEPTTIDPIYLELLVARFEKLLGPVLSSIESKARQGRQARRTPPREQHYLADILHRVRESQRSLHFDIRAITELQLVVKLLERWQTHPQWANVLQDLHSANDCRHVIIQCAVDHQFARLNLDAGLPRAVQGQRIPDLFIPLSRSHSIGIEVKVPLKLAAPTAPLNEDLAKSIVEETFKTIGPKRSGQLQGHQAGLIIIGGFMLRQADIDLLKDAALRKFTKSSTTRGQIAAVGILSIGMIMSLVEGEGQIEWIRRQISRGIYARPILGFELAPNPFYNGPIPFDFDVVAPERRPLIDVAIMQNKTGA